MQFGRIASRATIITGRTAVPCAYVDDRQFSSRRSAAGGFGRLLTALAMAICAGRETYAAERHVPAQFPTIQSGIAASSHGDVVVVAPGVYAEKIDFMDRAIVVRGSEGPEATVINSLGIAGSTVRAVGVPAGVTLEGFTISGGSAQYGGGVYALAAPMTMRDCIITECDADFGAGAYFAANQQITIERCRFEGLESEGTSAIFCAADLVIAESVFRNNRSGENPVGGVIRILNTGSIDMRRCTMSDNQTLRSSVVQVSGAASSFIECEFTGNAGWLGGALGVTGHSVSILRCVFQGNSGTQGGAINLNHGSGSGVIDQCVFRGNRALNLPLSGGALGGAVFGLGSAGSLTIRACVFEDNESAGSGGALYPSGAEPVFVENCTFIGNKSGANGGAIRRANGDLNVVDCHFSGNQAELLGGALATSGDRATISIGNSFFCKNDAPVVAGLAWINLGNVIIQSACTTPGDITGDGIVNVQDVLAVVAGWGACADPHACVGDVNGDFVANVADLLLIISHWS